MTHTSLDFDPAFELEDRETVRCVFFGLGSDGTVGANKNSIKIIGEETDNYAQGYFVYDSKKSGAITISHLRFGPQPIRAPYLISNQANFVACHQFSFLEKLRHADYAKTGGVFLLNSLYGPEEVWDHLPTKSSKQIMEKKLKFYVIDALRRGREDRAWAGASTPSCRPASSLSRASCPATRPSSRSRRRSRRPTASAAKRWCRRTSPPWMRPWRTCIEVKVPRSDQPAALATRRRLPTSAPDFVQNVIGPMMRLRGRQPAGQRYARWTAPSRPAPRSGRNAISP